jgi:Mg-chelatase subunit ChlD
VARHRTSSQPIEVIRDKASAGSCVELAASEYPPRASTPLLDAVGHGVALLDKRKEPGERCILAVMTDGLENACRELHQGDRQGAARP